MLSSRAGQLILQTTPDWKHEPAESEAVYGYLGWEQRPWGCMDFYGFCLLHGKTYAGLYRHGNPYTIGGSPPTTGWQMGIPHGFALLVVGTPLMLA